MVGRVMTQPAVRLYAAAVLKVGMPMAHKGSKHWELQRIFHGLDFMRSDAKCPEVIPVGAVRIAAIIMQRSGIAPFPSPSVVSASFTWRKEERGFSHGGI